jgi:hypothetical protein
VPPVDDARHGIRRRSFADDHHGRRTFRGFSDPGTGVFVSGVDPGVTDSDSADDEFDPVPRWSPTAPVRHEHAPGFCAGNAAGGQG